MSLQCKRELPPEDAIISIDCLAAFLKKQHSITVTIKWKLKYIYMPGFKCRLCGVDIERNSYQMHYPCEQFFTAIVAKITTFYRNAILPELIGKWYTKKYSTSAYANKPTSSSTSETTEWCYCKFNHEDDLIGCDNLQWSIQWFHFVLFRDRKGP